METFGVIEQEDPLYAAQAELRHMKQTVDVLRDELEHARIFLVFLPQGNPARQKNVKDVH